jgi:peptide/nickel transport system permease protein
MVVVILGVTLLVFLMMHLAPGDPAQVIAIARYGEDVSNTDIEAIRIKEGLDAPVYVQYRIWLDHLIHLDLGTSLITGRSVLDEILNRFPATLQLALAGMLISLIIAIPLGIFSAVWRNSFIDYFGMTFSLLGASMPGFWLALLLIMFFAVYLGWFPVFGKGDLSNIILPASTIGLGLASVNSRLIRSSILDVMGQNYIRTARAKGLSDRAIIVTHALKNALVPLITMVGIQMAALLEGSVIVETIFSWPGIGKLLVNSIYLRDFPMIQGCVLFIVVSLLIVNLMVDISYLYLDPRIRYDKPRA